MATLAVTERAGLMDARWAVLEPLLPARKRLGRPPEQAKRQLSPHNTVRLYSFQDL